MYKACICRSWPAGALARVRLHGGTGGHPLIRTRISNAYLGTMGGYTSKKKHTEQARHLILALPGALGVHLAPPAPTRSRT